VAPMSQVNAMEIIPAIDLRDGTVVHARMGRRDEYRPLQTPLAASSDPVDVTRGLLSLHPFMTFYVADLDAIERRGDNRPVLLRLKSAFPQLTFWVDNGIGDRDEAEHWLDAGLGHLVIGSETQADAGLIRSFAGDKRIALSLDFMQDSFRGPAPLLADTASWPRQIIVMTLARVGSRAGPDLERLSAICDSADGRAVYAAGGVRDAADLVALQRAGAAGALVASCLHDGRLTAGDISGLQYKSASHCL
jgi:phosphoribosylformimino-5-aminoimidazole carboxamide ribotide isomerase